MWVQYHGGQIAPPLRLIKRRRTTHHPAFRFPAQIAANTSHLIHAAPAAPVIVARCGCTAWHALIRIKPALALI